LEDEKPGKSGGDSDDEDVAPPTEAPDDTLPTEAGKDPGPLGSLKARLKKFRESKEKNMGAKVLQGSIIIRGEPRMTNESLIFITGLSPGKNGIYRVISCQTVTSPTFTTSLQVQYVNVPPVKPDIGALSAAHDLATGGEPDVIKDNEVEPPNTATGPGIAGNTSLEGRPEIPRVR
jgi:hypothetical protein